MEEIKELDRGTLTAALRQSLSTRETVKKYKDSQGRARFVGTPELSKSQCLGSPVV